MYHVTYVINFKGAKITPACYFNNSNNIQQDNDILLCISNMHSYKFKIQQYEDRILKKVQRFEKQSKVPYVFKHIIHFMYS